MQKKEIRCYTHHSLDGGWADVWITYDERRRKRHFGPTLLTYESVLGDLDLARKCAASYPDQDWSGDIAHHVGVLDGFALNDYVITTECGEAIPSIHTNAKELSKPEIERMLEHFLRLRGVKAPLKFSWNKPEITVYPA
jgi:hypothetical protein